MKRWKRWINQWYWWLVNFSFIPLNKCGLSLQLVCMSNYSTTLFDAGFTNKWCSCWRFCSPATRDCELDDLNLPTNNQQYFSCELFKSQHATDSSSASLWQWSPLQCNSRALITVKMKLHPLKKYWQRHCIKCEWHQESCTSVDSFYSFINNTLKYLSSLLSIHSSSVDVNSVNFTTTAASIQWNQHDKMSTQGSAGRIGAWQKNPQPPKSGEYEQGEWGASG